jgi:hypothetical protein
MLDEPNEFHGDNRHRFVVRECDSDDGCVVIEQWVTPEGSGDGIPTHDVHIPADLVTVVAKALLLHGASKV